VSEVCNLVGSVTKLNKEKTVKKYLDFKRGALATTLGVLAGLGVGIVSQDKQLFILVAAIYITFWVGVAWAHLLTAHEMKEKFSYPLDLIDKDRDELNPLMKVGRHYNVLAHLDQQRTAGDQLYVLHGTSGDDNGKIFCVWTEHDLVLPHTFRVIRRIEDRGGSTPITSFVFGV
jgi:hypothetical protein